MQLRPGLQSSMTSVKSPFSNSWSVGISLKPLTQGLTSYCIVQEACAYRVQPQQGIQHFKTQMKCAAAFPAACMPYLTKWCRTADKPLHKEASVLDVHNVQRRKDSRSKQLTLLQRSEGCETLSALNMLAADTSICPCTGALWSRFGNI